MKIDQHSFIISMTRAHLLDQKVISQALRTNAGYIGMIGSRKKANTIFSMLATGRIWKKGILKECIHRLAYR